MSDPTKELIFQSDVIAQMVASGWKCGAVEDYHRARALYPEDVIGFVKDTQPEQWQKFCALYPTSPEQESLERVGEQLGKADPNAADQTMRTFGLIVVTIQTFPFVLRAIEHSVSLKERRYAKRGSRFCPNGGLERP